MLHEPIYNAQIVDHLGERVAARRTRRAQLRSQRQPRHTPGRIRRVTATALLRVAARLVREPVTAAPRYR